MRVLQIVPYYPPAWGYGGPPRIMYSIAKTLVDHGHQVSVYTTDAYQKNIRVGVRKDDLDGIKVFYFKNISNYLAWNKKKFFPLGFRSFLKKTVGDFDIIHISGIRNYLNLVVYPVIKKNKIPYVIDAHGSLPVATQWLKGFAKIYDRFFVKPLLRDADLLLAQTQHEVEMYKSLGGREKNIKIVPLSIDLKEFSDLPVKGTFRQRYRIRDEDKIITFLGRINQGKGVNLVLSIFRELAARENKLKLVIIGRDDGYLDEIQKMVRDYQIEKNVIFTGPLYGREKLSAYVDTDLFLFTPTYWEETSTASLEAMACYTPVIVSKQAEIPYLTEYQAGFCLEYDQNKIVGKAREILGDNKKQQQYGLNARRLVQDRFNIEKTIPRLEKLFVHAAKQRIEGANEGCLK